MAKDMSRDLKDRETIDSHANCFDSLNDAKKFTEQEIRNCINTLKQGWVKTHE